jgi:predicted  nucleic acid-binding Zn-ribbon protein
MLQDIGWRDVVALLTSATIMSGIVIAWVKYRLAGDFASKSDITDMSRRMEGIETQMRQSPTHADMAKLSERLSTVERGVAVGNAELGGLRDGMARIERDLNLLVQHHIKTGT